METKFCNICKSDKDIDEFHFRSKMKNTRKSTCKVCVKGYDKIAYKEGKKTGNSPISKVKITKRNQTFLLNYLENQECTDCGIKDIRVLEFDHLRDKTASVSSLKTSASIKRLLQEIAKCEVVCSNCHRIRTFTRLNSYRTQYYDNLNL